MFLEIAIGSPRNRGLLVSLEEYHNYVIDRGSREPVYRSVYLYTDEAQEYVKKRGTLKDYFGIRGIDDIPVDIDKGDNTDEYTQQKAKDFVNKLEDLDLEYGNYQIYFSGTGYHIMLSGDLFNFIPNKNLPFVVKQTMLNMSAHIDPSIYMRTGIYRSEHSLNQKSQLFKIPLTQEDLFFMKANEIKEMASERRLSGFVETELYGNGELKKYIVTDVPSVRALNSVAEPKTIVPCVQKMYNQGPQEGNRNNTVLRIASHFRRNGIPSDAAKAALLHWNNKILEEGIILDKVEAVYNAGYKYGCNDSLLAKYCSPKCIYFKRKDYLVDVMNSNELQTQLKDRLSTDFSGQVINIAKLLGIDNEQEASLYPGDMLTIFGPTGANKTTFAQNLVLGYDALNDVIRKEWQVPTLFLSLELSGWYLHRRNLQIVSGRNKEETNEELEYWYEQHEDELSHMVVQTVAPTIVQIQQKIKELQPACVVVDYIDLIETPGIRSEYEQIKAVSHSLRSMAVNEDIIVIQISQVSRDRSRTQDIDLFSGKGSGAIENASSKVIGITGTTDSPEKKIEMLKNTDGSLWTTKLKWTPSFRMRRDI